MREYLQTYVQEGLRAAERKHGVHNSAILATSKHHKAYVEELRAALMDERRGEAMLYERMAMRALAKMVVGDDKHLALEATREIYRRWLECYGSAQQGGVVREMDIQVWSARLRERYADKPDELIRISDEFDRTGVLPELE